MKRLLFSITLAHLAGCATAPEPPAPIVPAPVICVAPASMLQSELPPPVPAGDNYTQRDVAAYLAALHRWATAGWARIAAIESWSNDCEHRSHQ